VLTVIQQPTWEPVSLELAKEHLRITHSDEDLLINTVYLRAARAYAETCLRMTLPETRLRENLDGFPDADFIRLQLPPIQSVDAILYMNTSNEWETWDEDEYVVNLDNHRIMPVTAWPTISSTVPIVRITYTAGYQSAADIPENYKLAILQFLSHAYNNREAVIVGTINSAALLAGEALLTDRELVFG